MEKWFFGNHSLDTLKSKLYYKGEALEVEPQVYCILELLITRHGEIISRDEIIAEVWNGRVISNNLIDNRIRAARAAIGDTGKAQRYIKTYPNRGYKFVGKVLPIEDDTAHVNTTKAPDAELVQSETVNRGSISKQSFFSLKSPATYIVGAALLGLFGIYAASQSTNNITTEPPSHIGVADSEKGVFPRVGILPIETVGDVSAYGLLPDVLEGEFNQNITAIEDLTVVSFVPGPPLKDKILSYKALKEDFNLDFVIASKLTSYGELFKLTISLVRVQDRSVLDTQSYDLNVSNEEKLNKLIANIASKMTLMTANKLNLSVEELPTSWRDYDFYAKFKEAESIAEAADYESLKKANQLFREVISEEPNYIPAYASLIMFLSWQIQFVIGDYEALVKEQIELAIKMQEISPGAPETLLINSAMGLATEGGVDKAHVGEFVEGDHEAVINSVLKKDPDNFLAMSMLAYVSDGTADPAYTLNAYKNTLELTPTDPWTLANYSLANFCNEDYYEARDVVNRLKIWHPSHRYTTLAEMRQALALGNYDVALKGAKQLLNQGIINHEETGPLRALFFDLGYPELILPHVRFPPAKAHIYAMMDDKEAALKEAAVIEKFVSSIVARLIVDDAYFPEDYSVSPAYARVGEPDDLTRANSCQLGYLIRDTYVLEKIGSDKLEPFLALLTEYFEDRDLTALKTGQEHTALMGLHVLQGNHDKALEVMDIAMAHGFLFISSFREPFLRELQSHPGFSERLNEMKKSANLLVSQHFSEVP